MAKNKRYRGKKRPVRDDESQVSDQDEEEGMQISIETILLGVIALILIFQTWFMYQNNPGDNSESNIPAVTTPSNNQQTTPSPATIPGQNQNANNQATQPADNTPQTSIAFPETDANLGTVPTGATKEHTFTVNNTGSEDMVFGRVYGDEGIRVVNSPGSIPAGESGEIQIEYTAGSTAGNESKRVHVNTNTTPPHNHLNVSAVVQ